VLEVLGPFASAEALIQWRSKTPATMDSGLCRYDMVSAAELLPPSPHGFPSERLFLSG
jgi:hypothetical protein